MAAPTPSIIEAGDGRIHEARAPAYDDDPAVVEAANGDIVEAEGAGEDRDDDLRHGRLPPQQAAAQSAAQATATTTAEPDARQDATLPAARKPDDPVPAADPVTPDKADEPLNPYLTEDKADPLPDPVADDATSGDDAAATE